MDFLVLGSEKDPHVQGVIARLMDAGHTCSILDYSKPSDVVIYHSNHDKLSIFVGSEPVDKVRLIWDRLKLFPGSPFYFDVPDVYYENIDTQRVFSYMESEWRSLYALIRAKFPERIVNDPRSSRRMHKLLQQEVAAACGFLVPRTLATNSFRHALDFVRQQRRSIIKSFSGALVRSRKGERPEAHGMMTMPVSEKDLLEAGEDALAACPHLFQEEIRKDFELRIVVVGSRVFPFRIDSQKKKLTQFDWRYGHFLLEFTECRIPEKVKTSLKRFLKAWNLLSGSFDLIVDELGQFWFLECNQDGAWGWLDEIVGGRISDAFATTFSDMISNAGRSSAHGHSESQPLETRVR